jgi:hypothetical protein
MLHVDVRYQLPMTSSVDLGVAEFRRVLQAAWSDCGYYLFNNFVAKHFSKEGKGEYGYQPRAGEDTTGKDFWRSYTGRKQKKYHHTLAMVLTGRTREGAKRATVYPTSKGVRVALPACVHLNQYKPRAKIRGPHAGDPPIDLRDELMTVTGTEADTLAKIHEAAVVRLLGGRRGWADKQMK